MDPGARGRVTVQPEVLTDRLQRDRSVRRNVERDQEQGLTLTAVDSTVYTGPRRSGETAEHGDHATPERLRAELPASVTSHAASGDRTISVRQPLRRRPPWYALAPDERRREAANGRQRLRSIPRLLDHHVMCRVPAAGLGGPDRSDGR